MSLLKGSMMDFVGNKRTASKNDEGGILETPLHTYGKDHRTAEYQDADIKTYVNEGEVAKESVKAAIAHFKSLGINSNTGSLKRISFAIKQASKIDSSLTSKRIGIATSVYEYSIPYVSDKTVRIAVKFDGSKHDKCSVSPIILDQNNQRIAANSKEEFVKFFYTGKPGVEVTEIREPKLAMYNGEKYVEIDVKDKHGVVACLEAKGFELKERMGAEGLDHPFTEIVVYDTKRQAQVELVIKEFEADQEGTETKEIKLEGEEAKEALCEMDSILEKLSVLYDEAINVEDELADALTKGDESVKQVVQEKRDKIQTELKELEGAKNRLRERVRGEDDEKEENDEESDLPGNLMRDDNEEEVIEEDDIPAGLIGDGKDNEKKEEKKAEAGWFQNLLDAPILGPKQLAMIGYVDTVLKKISPTPTDIRMLHSMLSSSIANDKKKEQIKQYLEKHEPFGDNIVRANKVEAQAEIKEGAILEKAEEHAEKEADRIKKNSKEAAMRVARPIFMLANSANPQERLEAVTQMATAPDKWGKMLNKLAGDQDESVRNAAQNALGNAPAAPVAAPVAETVPAEVPAAATAKKVTAQLNAKYKVGERVYVKPLNRTGEIAGIGRLEDNDMVFYSVLLDGITDAVNVTEAAIDVTKTEGNVGDTGAMVAPGQTLGQDTNEKKLENFPATTTPEKELGMSSAAKKNVYGFRRATKSSAAAAAAAAVVAELGKSDGAKLREETSQAKGVEKYNEKYKKENLGSGFYKPIKTAETIIKDVTNHRFQSFQEAFDNYTTKWDEEPKKEVIAVLARLKVNVK